MIRVLDQINNHPNTWDDEKIFQLSRAQAYKYLSVYNLRKWLSYYDGDSNIYTDSNKPRLTQKGWK